MGYVLVPTQVGGLPSFELAGYSPAMLEAFSTRRRDILDYIADKGWKYGAKTAQAATLHTRKRKDEPAPGELSAMWKARAEALGLARDADEVRLDRTERGFARPPARFTPLEAVWQATEHLEERHAVFSESDLLAAALGREPGRHTHVDLQTEIVRLREDGHLVAAGDGALTTRRTLRAEKEVVRRMREGKGTAQPLAPEEEVAGRLAATELTEGQKAAVRLILRSPDPVVGVQGFAGTGKTRMLNEVGLCCKLGEGAMRNQGASCSPYDSALARRSCSNATASVRAHGPRSKARSTIRASPTMPPWRANIPAWPLRSARITSKPLIVA